MSMLAIKIGHGCTACGACDRVLPGIRAELNKLGAILANPYNPDVDWERIEEAVRGCEVGAFTLENV